MTQPPPLTIYLAAPRGFCAGVERAIVIVEQTLEKYGKPVYVRHEIVHNKHVVEGLKKKGAIFVEELDECPDDRPVIFSAHGVPKIVPQSAKDRNMVYVDATCPLVSKVHREAEHYYQNGYHIILIGHHGHPEVIGTMGQVPNGFITLIESVDDFHLIPQCDKLALITQTTLSVDDTKDIIAALKEAFPHVSFPKKDDICYATTNRQNAVRAIAEKSDAVLVIGDPTSSNSLRLVDVAKASGCPQAYLIHNECDITENMLQNIHKIGVTASASAPEELVTQVLNFLKASYTVTIETVETSKENIIFKAPANI